MRYMSSSSSSASSSSFFSAPAESIKRGAEAGRRGSLGGSVLGQDGRKDRGLSGVEGGGWMDQWGRTTGRIQEEVWMRGRAAEREGGVKKRWDIQWICINRRRAGKAAARKPTQACGDPAASPLD